MLAVELDHHIDREIQRQNPLGKALESQLVTQLLPALESVKILCHTKLVLPSGVRSVFCSGHVFLMQTFWDLYFQNESFTFQTLLHILFRKILICFKFMIL